MPINPNIALGAQPQQPVNMLRQVGQMLALKAATQEMQGNEEMRSLFSGGANFDDPEFQRRGYAANPKAFQELLGKRATTNKAQMEALKDEITLRRDAIVNIRTPEEYLAWHEANHQGKLGAFFKSAGINPSRESIMAELSKPGGLDKLKRASALGATALQKELMQTERTYGAASISAGPSYERNRMQKEKNEYERKNPTLSQVQGENGFYLYNPRDPNSAVPLGMRPSASPPPVTQPSAVSNMLVTPGVAQPSVNALVQPAPNQPGAPTVANANALNQQPTIIRPKQPIRQPVAIMGPDGKSILVSPEQAVGKQPATAFNESTSEKKAQLNRDLDTVIRNLELAVKPGGLLEKSTGSGAGRLYDTAKGFFGGSTEGAIAGAQLAPIADMVLKMVPRFEGPQSNKDVDSYLAAAGKLADTGLPNDVRQGAAKIILKLMKERKGQFEIKGQEGGSGGASAAPKTVTRTGTLNGRKVVEYSDGTTAYAD